VVVGIAVIPGFNRGQLEQMRQQTLVLLDGYFPKRIKHFLRISRRFVRFQG
jgi:hypothetical protein